MNNDNKGWTAKQYEVLGRLVARWAHDPSNRYSFYVTPELGAPATLLCRVTDPTSDGEPMTLVHGIEPDGHCHT